ncbi:MAG: hypothetical protein QXK27_05060 [Candidatus Hadarchaeales archaeon]
MKLIALFSGGIDSPVACAMMSKRFEIVPLHFHTELYAGRESLERTVESLRRLGRVCRLNRGILIRWGSFLDLLVKSEYRKFTCLLCKKGMLRAAEVMCELEGASGIVTGEALGQKASQTLPNLLAISHGLRYPVFRPLLGMDKTEIEALARKLGIWSPSHAGGCKAVPPSPKTRSDPVTLEKIFAELGLEERIRTLVDSRSTFF